jgi:hypothetical protein
MWLVNGLASFTAAINGLAVSNKANKPADMYFFIVVSFFSVQANINAPKLPAPAWCIYQRRK